MALSLGLNMSSRWAIGETNVHVAAVGPGHRATIDVFGKKFHLTDDQRVEILPNVYACLGPIKVDHQGMRIVFEAPRAINIRRV